MASCQDDIRKLVGFNLLLPLIQVTTKAEPYHEMRGEEIPVPKRVKKPAYYRKGIAELTLLLHILSL